MKGEFSSKISCGGQFQETNQELQTELRDSSAMGSSMDAMGHYRK
jgi:hypothetical protein